MSNPLMNANKHVRGMNFTRKFCLSGSAALLSMLAQAAPGLLDVDYPSLISRADLTYGTAVDRSEAGMPVGNGRMGTLVWTTPYALRFQINRVDVFGNGADTDSFPERHTDYCGGCAFVDVEFTDFGGEVFPAEHTSQHLSCYDGLVEVKGRGVQARAFVWNDKDVMALQITDQRPKPGGIIVNLRSLRPPMLRTCSQLARTKLETRSDRIALTQSFDETSFHSGSAVAVAVLGRDAQPRRENDGESRLVIKPGRGTFTVLIASAASFNAKDDLAASALAQLDAAASKGFAELQKSNQRWWRDFWSKSFIHLHSKDGVADFIESNYNYFLYLMASSSRGKFPTKFNGMLWTTGGDLRHWGGEYWGANQSCLYNNALFAANHAELLEPMFDMLSGMAAACGRAAIEQWGSQGIYFPETVGFDGLPAMPGDIASEMRDLYLLRKPWEERSQRFREFAGTKLAYSSRWNWIGAGQWTNGRWVYSDRGNGPYGPVTHIFSRGAKYAYQYWLRYEYTQDQDWLRDRAYPILKGVAEFYRNYPNVKKGADGKYHILHVNSNESIRGARDTDEEISSMMGIFPALIKASRILNVDADTRPAWEEFLANLAPLPRSDNPEAPRNTNAAPAWIRGLPPVAYGNASAGPDGNTLPQWFFDLCTLESDPAIFKVGAATLRPGARRMGVLSKVPLASAIMGRADDVRVLIPRQFDTNERGAILANLMDLREGAQTTTAQRLGNASDALHTALCYDLPAGPAQPSVIRVFAAWPRDWDADYSLLCRGGFLVTTAMKDGQVQFVELQSQKGGDCRLRNPWGDGALTLYRDGAKAEGLSGSLLIFPTSKGETIVVVPPGASPAQFKRTVSVKSPQKKS